MFIDCVKDSQPKPIRNIAKHLGQEPIQKLALL